MAQRGGKRPGAGRKKGSRNKATDEQLGSLTDMAQSHAPLALEALVSIAHGGESEAARVAAANAILDRGYGKPVQGVEHEISGSLTTQSDDQIDARLSYLLGKAGIGVPARGGGEEEGDQ